MRSTTTTTTHSIKAKNTFVYTEEAVGIEFTYPNIAEYQIGKKFKKDEPGLIDLISDQPKVFISLSGSPYHLYHDYFGELLAQYKLTPNAKFIIDITDIKNVNPLPEYIRMIFKFLNDYQIDYRPIDLNANRIININNFYRRDPDFESYSINDPATRLYEFSQLYVKDKDKAPTKNVYLSRKNFRGRDLSFFIKGRLPYENDNRIDDEQKIEDYFRSLGYEIIVPEDFNTFEEQINFFYETKKLVSLTSSGLINSCFMQPGSTIIELTTPLISFNKIGNGVTDDGVDGQEEIHHFYHMISIAKNHNYISIPNVTRSSEDLLNKIEKSNEIKNALGI